MLEFRTLIIDYFPDTTEADFESMRKKAKNLKKSLVNGPLVIFDDQITIEPNYQKGYYLVIIDKIPDRYIKKVIKKCKEIEPYSVRICWREG